MHTHKHTHTNIAIIIIFYDFLNALCEKFTMNDLLAL